MNSALPPKQQPFKIVFVDHVQKGWSNEIKRVIDDMAHWSLKSMPFEFASHEGPIDTLYGMIHEGKTIVLANLATNSLGYMSEAEASPEDQTYARVFPWIPRMVSDFIQKLGKCTRLNRKYLPIGSAMAIPATGRMSPEFLMRSNEQQPRLIKDWYVMCPTSWMPPPTHGIDKTHNVYWAFLGLLKLLEKLHAQHSFDLVLVPGVSGIMPVRDAARQVVHAIDDFLHHRCILKHAAPNDEMAQRFFVYMNEPNADEQPQTWANEEFRPYGGPTAKQNE